MRKVLALPVALILSLNALLQPTITLQPIAAAQSQAEVTEVAAIVLLEEEREDVTGIAPLQTHQPPESPPTWTTSGGENIKLVKVRSPQLVGEMPWTSPGIQKQDSYSIELTLSVPTYEITRDDEGYDHIDVPGYSLYADPGHPLLPHTLIDVALPPDVDWDSVTLRTDGVEWVQLGGTYRLPLVVVDTAQCAAALETAIGPGASMTDVPRSHPSPDLLQPVRVLRFGQMRKWRFARLDFSPFYWIPETGRLSVASRVDLRLEFTRSGRLPTAEVLSDTVMDDVAQRAFWNYDAAQAWYGPSEWPLQQSPGYVIITTNAIESGSNALADFVSHKEHLGYNVSVITEDEYGSMTGLPPDGTAEKIREWLIRNYTAMNIEYVLLVGNPDPDDPELPDDSVGDVPMKMCFPREKESTDRDSPTDYFFADLTGTWDLDDDLLYGEYGDDYGPTDGVDLAPEVYVGRIPVYDGSYTELDSILEKIMDYETETGDLSWRKNVLLPMSFTSIMQDHAALAEQMWDDYLETAGYSRWRQYQQGDNACDLDSIYSNEEDLHGGTVVRDRWASNDYGLVVWVGHGNAGTVIVGVEPDCYDGVLFRSSYTSELDDDHPSLVYQCSCHNGERYTVGTRERENAPCCWPNECALTPTCSG